MITQELQEQASIIESKLLQIAGELKIDTMMKQPPSDDVQDELGEVLLVLQKMRQAFEKELYADGT